MICTLKQALSQDELKKLLAPNASTDARTDLSSDHARQVEAQYREFCATQAIVWRLVLTRRTQNSPLQAA